jgi:very-short-patch-repair endonuclease
VVEPIDALRQAILCQTPRASVASIDSALQLGFVRIDELEELFDALPGRKKGLRPHVDGRAESGTETLVRLMARALGGRVELQVPIDGVGRVDLLVDGWLVIECDSRRYHEGWAAQLEDRRRDLALAALGYTTIRPTAEDILFRPEVVVAAIRGLLHSRRAAKA